MQNIFYQFSKNITRIFRGYNLSWQVLAFFLTYIIITSGFDWFYTMSMQNSSLQTFLFPAVILGGLVPIFLPVILIAWGTVRKSKKLLNTSYAITQAALLGLVISSTYKAFTGRVPPPFHFFNTIGNNSIDTSAVFQFGFLHGGVFWGWPSSHTTIAFSVAIALVMLYPRNTLIRYLAPLFALYIGIGVSVSIHWFSDFVAGAIIGTIIGLVVGKSFYKRIVS